MHTYGRHGASKDWGYLGERNKQVKKAKSTDQVYLLQTVCEGTQILGWQEYPGGRKKVTDRGDVYSTSRVSKG